MTGLIDKARFQRSLFIGAHLDDIELAAGGTSALVASLGCSTYWLVLTDSSYESYDGSTRREKSRALEEGTAAATILNVRNLDVRQFPAKDLNNDSVVVECIEEVVKDFNPSIIFSHWPFDTHKAHANSALTSIAAARRRNSILMYEPIYPSGRSYTPFRPQMYFDISEHIASKLASIKEHRSEYLKYGEEWIEGVEARARFRGFEIGAQYAEAFEVLRLEG